MAITRRGRGGSVPRVGPEAATERLELRLTPEQRATWSAVAERRGMSLAELVRAAVEHYLIHEAGPRDALAELGREVVDLVRKRFPRGRAG